MLNRFKRIYSVCFIPSRLGRREALLQAASCAGYGQRFLRDSLCQTPSAERPRPWYPGMRSIRARFRGKLLTHPAALGHAQAGMPTMLSHRAHSGTKW